MVEEFVKLIRGAIESVRQAEMPHEIEVKYPDTSPFAGTTAGRYLLERTEAGSSYMWHPEARLTPQPEPEFAELVTHHRLGDVEDIVGWLDQRPDEVFVDVPVADAATIVAVDQEQPQRGSVTVRVGRHPAWVRWARVAGYGDAKDITHEQLADLVLDNREDLEEPAVAQYLAAFRAVKSVEYDADLGDARSESVRVTYKGRDGAQGDLSIPRCITAKLPAFTGAWPAGEEPRYVAEFRLRVLPPPRGSDDPTPRFRILWVNAPDFELQAARGLVARVRELMGERKVFRGVPDCARFACPW